ncbi:MAG: 30S ribosomal protein S14 [Gammaproteobacteria bacterium]|jgi:small subunit ribosomal protein S14|nr:30S ribosomal protein S14 [Gammaproteobacteria bacterium]
MAKTSMVNREIRRQRVIRKYAGKRTELKNQLRDPKLGFEEKAELRRRFQMLPRDASPTRLRNRCRLTGRPHGFYRKFGLGRNKLREAAMRGDVPGLVKASW